MIQKGEYGNGVWWARSNSNQARFFVLQESNNESRHLMLCPTVLEIIPSRVMCSHEQHSDRHNVQ